MSQLRIALSSNGTFTITSNGPHPGPASIEEPFPLARDTASQLFPGSLDSVADGAAYLRWRVFVSLDKVTPTLFTRHKTSNRWVYDRAVAKLPAQPPGPELGNAQLLAEVLIVKDSNEEEVMEGCIFTPYFKRDNKWITPEASCGGNLGTTRRWAVEKGICKLGVVKLSSVKCGEIIVLSNGVRGFQSGIVELLKSLLDDDTDQ